MRSFEIEVIFVNFFLNQTFILATFNDVLTIKQLGALCTDILILLAAMSV